MKINKNHNGKEFSSFFRIVGKVEKHTAGIGEESVRKPIFESTITTTNKPRKVLQFDVATTKYNKLKVELAGMEKEKSYVYSSADKKGVNVNWNDRFDKNKYPGKTYHLIAEPWDLTEEFGNKVKEDDWVEVKGKYEFSSFTNEEGKTFPIVKRIISSVELLEQSEEEGKVQVKDSKSGKYKVFDYVCDFESENFQEINTFTLEIGIKSIYQDEDTKDTKVNAVFLDYGKTSSTINDLSLMVYYKEVEEGTPLADAFAKLNKLDFVKVQGVDNNRPEFALIDNVKEEQDNDPFANVKEQVTSKKMAISGNKKGLEITGVIKNSWIKEMLKEEEVENLFPENEIEEIFKDDTEVVNDDIENMFN